MNSFINDKKGSKKYFNSAENPYIPSRPVITNAKVDQLALKAICPVHAIGANPARIDLGKCVFCRQCEQSFSGKIRFTDDHQVASNVRDRLIIIEGDDTPIAINESVIRTEVIQFREACISLMQLHGTLEQTREASGLSANMRIVNSPAEAHGVIITDQITDDIANALEEIYPLLRTPKLIIVAGNEALNSEMFGNASDDKIKSKYQIDMFIPGDPYHPTTLELALRRLMQSEKIEKLYKA
jgi:hypothetical protein